MEPKIITKIPGPKSAKILNRLKKLNGGYAGMYPFVHNKEGSGCYFKDIDGNTFLDFASQVGSITLGYNNPELKQVIAQYSKYHPVKYAGQDFAVKEHLDFIEELITITPKGMNAAFLINSGAEAVENCLKIALRKQKYAKFGISFEGAFHGRTLGALSCTNSKAVHKKHFLSIPMKRLPFNESALEGLQRIIEQEAHPSEIGFIIIEPIQGEGGYNIASEGLIKGLRKFTKEHDIPFIADEVQTGMGRTGKWWALQHYNITPDIMASAKALQVGAAIANRKLFPEEGAISSTWGGGHILDLAVGLETIRIIKRKKLLGYIQKMGLYLVKRLIELQEKNPKIKNARGKGLMVAFDMPSKQEKDSFIKECLKKGLVMLGCGKSTVRLIPPYIVSEEEIDKAISIINSVL